MENSLNNITQHSKRNFNEVVTDKSANGDLTRINDIMYIKIVNSEDEFSKFISGDSIEKNTDTFQPKFTNQIINQEESVKGYTGLEILLALSPCTLSPYFKINFKYKKSDSDDIEKLFRNFLGDYFNQNKEEFLRNLKSDLEILNLNSIYEKAKLVKQEETNNFSINTYLLYMPVENLKLNLHVNLQRFATFFIDGASEIPISHGHWYYYLILQEPKVNQKGIVKLLGFSSLARFSMSIKTYRSMISQFLIIPSFQRSGYGFKLLDNIYNNEAAQDSCVDISTEDPGDDYIYLRDAVLFKNTVNYFKSKVKNITSISKVEDYDKLTLEEIEIEDLSKKWKLSSQLVRRYEILVKYIVASDKINLEDFLFQDVNAYLVNINKEVFTPKKGEIPSFIFFEDDEEFDSNAILNEDQDMEKLAEDLQKFSDQLFDDFHKIKVKCLKLIA
jgi:histone acetyltransferase 1